MAYRNGEEVMDDPVWFGRVDCADGVTLTRIYEYEEHTTFAEDEKQHDIEAELIDEAYLNHGGCEFYSVGVVERSTAEDWL